MAPAPPPAAHTMQIVHLKTWKKRWHQRHPLEFQFSFIVLLFFYRNSDWCLRLLLTIRISISVYYFILFPALLWLKPFIRSNYTLLSLSCFYVLNNGKFASSIELHAVSRPINYTLLSLLFLYILNNTHLSRTIVALFFPWILLRMKTSKTSNARCILFSLR